MREDPVSRRSFVTHTALLLGAASVGGGCRLVGGRRGIREIAFELSETGFIINPAFRSMESDAGGLELFTFLPGGKRLSYTFSGLQADLLSAIRSRSHVKDLASVLAPRYGMSEEECMTQVMRSIEELHATGVVLLGDTYTTTVVETRYEWRFQGYV